MTAPDHMFKAVQNLLANQGASTHGGYDEPETLPCSIDPICLIGADAGQVTSGSCKLCITRSENGISYDGSHPILC